MDDGLAGLAGLADGSWRSEFQPGLPVLVQEDT